MNYFENSPPINYQLLKLYKVFLNQNLKGTVLTENKSYW